MADDPATPAKPPFDPAEFLGKVENIINANKAPASSGGGSKSWISYIIIIAVVLAGIAVWVWLSNRSNAELAKLRHEKEVQRIKAEKAAVDAEVAKSDDVAEAAKKVRLEAEAKQAIVEADIKFEEERYAANLRAIDRIRSWDDVPSGR